MLQHSATELDNGLRVVTVEQPHLHSAHVSLLVRCGSRHEGDAQWGLSHLLEHMLFRGSGHFPDARQLAHVFERSGGALQASTWRDHTCFSASLHPSHLRPVLAAMADMVLTPRLTDLSVERQIVEAELQSELDESGEDADLDNVSRAAVWPDHPMGRRIIGSLDRLRSFDEGDLRAHHERHYVGHNAVLSVAGRIDAQEVASLAADCLGGLPSGKPTPDGSPARFAPRATLATKAYSASQVALQLTFEALPDSHPDFAAQALLTSILDDGMTTRLPHALCDRRGLVYELSSGLDCYADCGLYDIAVQVDPRRVLQASKVIFDVLGTLCASLVNDEELAVAQLRHLHELEFRADCTEDLAQHFGVQSLFGTAPLRHEAERLQAVTASDVQRVATRLFGTGRVHATLMGPLERADVPALGKLLERFARGQP